METALAIYEALIQANVPQPAARRVAESLERDMSSNLATKQDLQHLSEVVAGQFEAVNTRFEALDKRIDARFSVQDEFISLKMDSMESRIVIKLGVLMTVLFGVAGTILALVS